MVHASTIATFGHAKAIVTTTGMKTEVGKIAAMLSVAESKQTPLQKSLEDFGNWLGKLLWLFVLWYLCFMGSIREIG